MDANTPVACSPSPQAGKVIRVECVVGKLRAETPLAAELQHARKNFSLPEKPKPKH